MKKLIILIAGVIIVSALFFFDSPPESEPYMEGYVVESDFMRVLVVDGITEEQAKSISEKEVAKLHNANALWASKYNFFQFRQGQKVKVWVSSDVQESFPEQAKADYIEVVRK